MRKSIHTKEHKALVERLKKARLESHLSQVQVAQKLGCSQSYISKIEAGELKMDVVELQRLAKIYKKSVSFFLN